jgi:hypothetical protein
MAGTYPDVPGHRMAYDRDGSVVAKLNITDGSVNATLSQAERASLNDEDSDGYIFVISNKESACCVIFPELRDVVGYHFQQPSGSGISSSGLATSVDTTNGIDGTWVSRGAWTTRSFSVPDARNLISAVSWLGIKAVRFEINNTSVGSNTAALLHLYGVPSAGENPDSLRLWHPTLDQQVGGAYFDWGDVPRSSSDDRDFRIKNNSAALTATDILVSIESQSDTVPSVAGQHLLERSSSPGFAATVTVPSLTPGEISEVLTLRRVTPSTAVLSLWGSRMLAEAASWA